MTYAVWWQSAPLEQGVKVWMGILTQEEAITKAKAHIDKKQSGIVSVLDESTQEQVYNYDWDNQGPRDQYDTTDPNSPYYMATYTVSVNFVDGTIETIATGLDLDEAVAVAEGYLKKTLPGAAGGLNPVRAKNVITTIDIIEEATGEIVKSVKGAPKTPYNELSSIWTEYQPLWIAIIAAFAVAIGAALLLKWYKGELKLPVRGDAQSLTSPQ